MFLINDLIEFSQNLNSSGGHHQCTEHPASVLALIDAVQQHDILPDSFDTCRCGK
jgi:hypothetical protein